MTFVDESVALDSDLTAEVERRLTWFFDSQLERARRLARATPALSQFEALWVQAAESARGGKKIRPALVLGAFNALNASRSGGVVGRDLEITPESVIDVAAAFELLHTAFLLHDDVIDGDIVRRGKLNLIGQFAAAASDAGVDAVSARRWGEACAILAGDLLIHGAHTVVDRAGLPESLRLQIQQVFDDALFVTAAGEQGDVGLAVGVIEPGFENILGITRAKTAHYSFADPLRAAAVLAGAGAEVTDLLERIGSVIGEAFQLRDDVLGVFGDEKVTGKSVNGDLRNGKVTALVAFAHQSPAGRGCADVSADRVPETNARTALQRSGARQAVEHLIQDHRRLVLKLSRDARLPPELQNLLTDFLNLATERES